MATQEDIDQRYSIKDVFELVSSAIRPSFQSRMATVDVDGKETQIPLTDFILRCVAEQMIDRWTGDVDNKNKVVETVLENGGYGEYVIPTGKMGGLSGIYVIPTGKMRGLSGISGGRRGRSIGSRKTRRHHK
jgi:hypothetical protein